MVAVSGVAQRLFFIVLRDLALVSKSSISRSKVTRYSSQGNPLMVSEAPVFFTENSDLVTRTLGFSCSCRSFPVSSFLRASIGLSA